MLLVMSNTTRKGPELLGDIAQRVLADIERAMGKATEVESFGDAAQRLLAKLEARIAEKKASEQPIKGSGRIDAGRVIEKDSSGNCSPRQPDAPARDQRGFVAGRFTAPAGSARWELRMRMGTAAQGPGRQPLVSSAPRAAQARRRELIGSWVGLAANCNRDHGAPHSLSKSRQS